MKPEIALILTLALAAGPACAQGTFGSKPKQTWSPGTTVGAPTPPKSYGVPDPATGSETSTSRRTPKTYGAPEAPTSPGFKPYEGYKTNPGTSIYAPDRKTRR